MNRLNTEESVIPYEYHHFDFCPINEENSPVENLGQVVFGERIRPGPYKIEFLKDVKCQKVKHVHIYVVRIRRFIIKFIRFRVNLVNYLVAN